MTFSDTIALALIAGLLATMPVFALAARGRARDGEVATRGHTVLLGWWIRNWMMWAIGPIERILVRAEVDPDVLSAASVLLSLAAGGAFAWGLLGAAGWLILLAGAVDNLDGRVARARGLASAYGAFLDSTLDRFAEIFVFLGLILFLTAAPLATLAAAGAMAGSMLVSYTRARGEALGVRNTSGVMQRAERLVLLALGALLDPVAVSWFGWPVGRLLTGAVTLIALGAFGTALYRTVAIARALSYRRAS